MKKLLTMIALVGIMSLSANSVNAQATKYLNIGGAGTGFYASIEFPVSSVITIAPQVSTDYNFNSLVFAGKGNYYLDDVFELTDPWDVYAGVNLGWRVETGNDGFNWGIHVGARWFWSDKWGVNVEVGGGSGVLGGVGVTMKM
jgi:hypothetical protein